MGQVRVILREDVYKLGEAGEVVSVKPGYARNFLLPRGMAIPATESRIKELDHHKRVIEAKMAKPGDRMGFYSPQPVMVTKKPPVLIGTPMDRSVELPKDGSVTPLRCCVRPAARSRPSCS